MFAGRRKPGLPFAPIYGPALGLTVVVEALFFLLTWLMLDGGETNQIYSVAMLSHWAAIIIILGRRPLTPTMVDLFMVRFGVLVLWAITFYIAPSVLSRYGEGTTGLLEKWTGLAFFRL